MGVQTQLPTMFQMAATQEVLLKLQEAPLDYVYQWMIPKVFI